MDQWEYREVDPTADFEDLGEKGWDACCLLPNGKILLKRPAPSMRDTLTQESVAAFFAQGAPEMGAPEDGSKLLNAELAHIVRSLGHTDMLVISDMGFPMPELRYNLDLALTPGVPTVPDVLNALAMDFSFDRIIIAAEARRAVPERVKHLETSYGVKLQDAQSHVAFKYMAGRCKAGVRTGDPTPFGNVILVCG